MESIEILKQKTQAHKRRPRNFILAFGYVWHRNISIYVTYFFIRYLGFVAPNQISFLMILVGILGACLLFQTDIVTQVIGVTLIYFSFILDKVDGEVARYQERYSMLGMYLDEVYHTLIYVLTLLAFFSTFIFSADRLLAMSGIIFLLLTVYRRYERKTYLMISHKVLALGNHFPPRSGSSWLRVVANTWFFKISSLVERFDLLLLILVGVIICEQFVAIEIRYFIFWFYVACTGLYALRRFLLSCSGQLDDDVNAYLQN